MNSTRRVCFISHRCLIQSKKSNVIFVYLFHLGYFLPKLYYGDMITLGLEGPFLPDTNKSDFKVTLTLLSNPIEPEVSPRFPFRP